jgi:flagellar hook-length control protein FliK
LPTPIEQIKVQIEQGLKQGGDTITVQLRPENLGRVEIKLEMQDGQVKATVTADRPETLQLLKNDAASLQQSLHNAGLDANAGSLSFQLRSDQQRQANPDGNGQNPGQADPDGTAEVAATPSSSPTRAASGRVDISV